MENAHIKISLNKKNSPYKTFLMDFLAYRWAPVIYFIPFKNFMVAFAFVYALFCANFYNFIVKSKMRNHKLSINDIYRLHGRF